MNDCKIYIYIIKYIILSSVGWKLGFIVVLKFVAVILLVLVVFSFSLISVVIRVVFLGVPIRTWPTFVVPDRHPLL